jgi:hypothetical protein
MTLRARAAPPTPEKYRPQCHIDKNIPRDPFRELEDMSSRLNRVFEQRRLPRSAVGDKKDALTIFDWAPSVDIIETPDPFEAPSVRTFAVWILMTRHPEDLMSIEHLLRRPTSTLPKSATCIGQGQIEHLLPQQAVLSRQPGLLQAEVRPPAVHGPTNDRELT